MMHVITGGSGSGKSAYAEMWLTGKPEKSEEKKRYAHICILRPCVHLVQRHKRRLNATADARRKRISDAGVLWGFEDA